MANAPVKQANSPEQRLILLTQERDKEFIDTLKPFANDSQVSLFSLGTGDLSNNQGLAGGNSLPLSGGVMAGPIAFNPLLTEIVSNEIDVAKTTGLFTGRIILGGEGGDLNDILERITGNDNQIPGRMLSIQGIATETITIKHQFNGGGGGDIRTPTGNDWIINGEQNLTLIYDAVNDEWAFMDGALAGEISQWSTFPAVSDIDFATFDGINIDRLRFVISSGSPITASDASILRKTGGDFQFNLPTGSNFDFTVNDVDVLRMDNTFAIFRNTAGVYVLELQNANTGIIDLDQVGELRFKGEKQAGGLETYARILVNADDVDPAISLDARMTFLVMRDGNSEQFMAFNTTGNNNIDINKRIDMNDNEIDKTAGIFPNDNGLDDIGTLTNSYNSIFMDALHFVHSQVQVAGERMISFEAGGDMEYNVPTGSLHVFRFQGVDEYLISATLFQFKNLNQLQFLDSGDAQDIKINYQDPVLLFDLSGTASAVTFDNGATIPNFILAGSNSGAALLAHNLVFRGKDSGGSTNVEYGNIKVRQNTVTIGAEQAEMEFQLIETGTPAVTYLELHSALQEVRVLKELSLNNNQITGIDFEQFNERVGDPTVGANQGVFYVKDVSGNSRPFFDNNTEAPIELGAGGAVTFPITPDVDVRGTVTVNQAVDISQTDGHVTTMTLGADITVTFSGFPVTAKQQTWELHVLQDATGSRTLTISPTPVESFTIASGANKLTILTFLTNDGGTDIHVVPTLRGSISLTGTFLPLAGGTMTGDIVMGTNSITGIDDLTFTDDVTQPASTVTYLSKSATELIVNIPSADLINFKTGAISQMTINATTIDFQGNSVIDGILGSTITGVTGITGLGTQGQNLPMGNFNVTGVNQLTFNETGQNIADGLNGITYTANPVNDRHMFVTNSGEVFRIEDGFVDFFAGFFDMTERVSPADPPANQGRFFTKDVAGNTHPFFVNSTEPEVDLTVGSGANQQLSNLVATVAVNLSLVGTTDGIENLGTSTLRWGIAFLDALDIQDDAGTNEPAGGITRIVADTGGMNLGVAATNDAFDFFFGGVRHLSILEDGELQWRSSGKLHKIVPQPGSLDIVAELESNSVKLITGTGRTNENVLVQDLNVIIENETTDTVPMDLLLRYSNATTTGQPAIGNIGAEAEDSANVFSAYAAIVTAIENDLSTSRDGRMQLVVAQNNAAASRGMGQLSGIGFDIQGGAALKIAFFGVTPVIRPDITGSRGGNVALADLLTSLDGLGIITDSTTA